ncbi:MAG: hypothetical protein ACRD6W_03410 [Nitrososphaerales archaeon]
MNDPAALLRVEAHLSGKLREVRDKKGDNLLRRESGGAALLPEASRVVAENLARGLLRDLAKVVADLSAAHNPAAGEADCDWNRAADAIARTATRRAAQGLGRSFRAYRAERDVEGALLNESLPRQGADHRQTATPPPRDSVARADRLGRPGNLTPGRSAGGGVYAVPVAEAGEPRRSQAAAGDKPPAREAGSKSEGRGGPGLGRPR